MNCDICRRSHNATRLPFLCAVDARNHLYEGRIAYTQALVQNDEAERQVNAILSSQTEAKPQDGGRAALLRANIDRLRSDEAAAADRTSQIIAQAERLKADVEAARKEIEAKKNAIARKKSDLKSDSSGLANRRSRQLKEMEESIGRLRFKWKRSAETMAATRAFLCEEAARLYGLRQVKRAGVKKFEIGGVEIFDVHAMNSVSPEMISTILAHMAHILVLACHYLAIRLPAEITLPHRDYPRPTIFSLGSSHRHGEVPFPGSAQIPSAGAGGLDDEHVHVPRPRPLFIEKPLPTLAKEDPSTYCLFLEGVALLAYDIAWVCCSQRVFVGEKESYDDVCNMGQNLWRLLIGDNIHRRTVEPGVFPTSLTPPSGSPSRNEGEVKPKSPLGCWSHGTTHNNLNSAEGTEFIRSFRVLGPMKIVDRLKGRLSREAPMLEWEKIEGDEFEDAFDEGVLIKGRQDNKSGGRSGPASSSGRAAELAGNESIMSVRTVSTSAGVPDNGNANANPSRGTSGWTKLKNR
ncbi:UV radiation resistance protein and autophagy-related subunit 14-domain-containing protein [Diplogelasinospora grovesii]|uniref:Autophagy-related protein 14 n=1 Tax=Diplogelasinospora grovesii TaxID=303347 RepID=A0AAN6S9G2_9PEZI|nr:UV radiation resistance protein and autophagy-related subunit 14-domain-containing protein [Diplogelasinospora grovesii]